jgi:hypothetical protein
MRLLSARVRAVPHGEAYGALISRHFSEVRRLINSHPRVATMWHRGEGPKMLRRLLSGTIDEHAEPPVRSTVQRDYLARFFNQLSRFGSTNLKATIESNVPAIMHLLERPLAAQVTRAGGAQA